MMRLIAMALRTAVGTLHEVAGTIEACVEFLDLRDQESSSAVLTSDALRVSTDLRRLAREVATGEVRGLSYEWADPKAEPTVTVRYSVRGES